MYFRRSSTAPLVSGSSTMSRSHSASESRIPDHLIQAFRIALPVIEKTLALELPPDVVNLCIQQLTSLPTIMQNTSSPSMQKMPTSNTFSRLSHWIRNSLTRNRKTVVFAEKSEDLKAEHIKLEVKSDTPCRKNTVNSRYSEDILCQKNKKVETDPKIPISVVSPSPKDLAVAPQYKHKERYIAFEDLVDPNNAYDDYEDDNSTEYTESIKYHPDDGTRFSPHCQKGIIADKSQNNSDTEQDDYSADLISSKMDYCLRLSDTKVSTEELSSLVSNKPASPSKKALKVKRNISGIFTNFGKRVRGVFKRKGIRSSTVSPLEHDPVPDLVENDESNVSMSTRETLDTDVDDTVSTKSRHNREISDGYTKGIKAKLLDLDQALMLWLNATKDTYETRTRTHQSMEYDTSDSGSQDLSLDSLVKMTTKHHALETLLAKATGQIPPDILQVSIVELFPTLFNTDFNHFENFKEVVEYTQRIGEIDYASQWLVPDISWKMCFLYRMRLDLIPKWTQKTLFNMANDRQQLLIQLAKIVGEPISETINDRLFNILGDLHTLEISNPSYEALKAHYEMAIDTCDQLAQDYLLYGYEKGMLNSVQGGYVFEVTHDYLPDWNLKSLRALGGSRSFICRKLTSLCQQGSWEESDQDSGGYSDEDDMNSIDQENSQHATLQDLQFDGSPPLQHPSHWASYTSDLASQFLEATASLIPIEVAQSVLKDDSASSFYQENVFNIHDEQTYFQFTGKGDFDMQWQKHFRANHQTSAQLGSILRSISWALYDKICTSHAQRIFNHDPVFTKHPYLLPGGYRSNPDLYSVLPTSNWQDIYEHLSFVVNCGELHAEHLVITYIYVARMLDMSGQRLCDTNWRMITMVGLLLAVKVWDDYAVYNSDFAQIYSDLVVEEINHTELVFLSKLQYNVGVNCYEFARAYFSLIKVENTI
ncbi:hypothetical protein J3Q64DRAFT_1820631 [Phycomyces blakesleeanus]|uniref:Cyclin N-terminal domain-containing protein n=1 Tax=Phycomyces blakesleeanus TaxID=4837 RepID=A0ABR3B1F9_PHYBL